MNEQWRLFAEIESPEPVRERIGEEIERLRRLGWRAKWVNPEGSHLTVKFYGSVALQAVWQLRKALRAGVSDLPPFTLETAGAGVFPHLGRPRVLWLGVGGEVEALARLQRRVEELSLELGFSTEERPYHPHLTLARFRPEYLSSLRGLERQVARLATLPSLPIPVRALTLYRSELRPTGAVYTLVDTFALETGR